MKNIEHQNQHALCEWWKIKHKGYGLPEFALFAVPNGGARNAVTGAILKREGVRKGIPDLFLAAPNKSHHGMFIEMKAPKGVLTKEQKDFMGYASHCEYEANINSLGGGYSCNTFYSWQDAADAIHKYLTNN